MARISIRDLRNHGGDVVERAAHGETITITKAGKAAAELRSLGRDPAPAEVLLARWRSLPPLDPERLRADIEQVLESSP